MWAVRCFLLVSVFGHPVRQISSELISNETQAWEFLFAIDSAYTYGCESGNYTSLDLTTQNLSWQNFSDPLLKRAFNLTARKESVENYFKSISHLDKGKRKQTLGDMRNIFSNSTFCAYPAEDKRGTNESCAMLNLIQLIEKIHESNNIEELEYYWIAWRRSIGRMRNIYVEMMQLLKELRSRLDLPNYNDFWLNGYERPSEWIAQETEKAWQEMLPLYEELHAYVRKRLINFYGISTMKRDGPIPEHILGDTISYWWEVKDITLPYPEKDINITKVMEKNNVTNMDVLKLSEDVFHSLGFPYLDESIWSNMYLKPNLSCTSHFKFTCDFKIDGLTACFPVNEMYLHAANGILIAFYIVNHERHPRWPEILGQQANPAFLIGLRYAIQLSSWTSEYLSQFVSSKIPVDRGNITDQDINHLMKVALRYLPDISEVYKTERWIWDSFNFSMPENEFNKRWWEYSFKYQGICPPVKRTEEDFDPAFSKALATSRPSMKDFIGPIYSFQFYKAACQAAGHNDFLHRCNLYGNKAFGNKIRRVISLGQSKPWQEEMSLMTDAKSTNMDTKPLLEYFQPLYEWLKKENEDEFIGWKSHDPRVCP